MLEVAFLELDRAIMSKNTELNAHWNNGLSFWQSPFSHRKARPSDQAGRITPDPIKLDKGGEKRK